MDQAESGHAQQQEGGIQRGEEDPGEACWDSPHGLWGGGTPVGTPSSSHDRQHPPEMGPALSRSAQGVRPTPCHVPAMQVGCEEDAASSHLQELPGSPGTAQPPGSARGPCPLPPCGRSTERSASGA